MLQPGPGVAVQDWQGFFDSPGQATIRQEAGENDVCSHSIACMAFARPFQSSGLSEAGFGGQTKPIFHKKAHCQDELGVHLFGAAHLLLTESIMQAKTTKKIVLKFECTKCKDILPLSDSLFPLLAQNL